MTFLSVATLGLGLSMDAFAASLSQGAYCTPERKWPQALRIGLAFGFAQAVMPLVGWGLGFAFHGWFEQVDHWIAFVLLGILGLRMIYASFHTGDDKPACATGWHLGTLALATSIDAAVAGITLALLDIPVLLSCAIIGFITFAFSTAGVLMGRAAGAKLGAWSEALGGLVLIGLGTKVLVEHLSA